MSAHRLTPFEVKQARLSPGFTFPVYLVLDHLI